MWLPKGLDPAIMASAYLSNKNSNQSSSFRPDDARVKIVIAFI